MNKTMVFSVLGLLLVGIIAFVFLSIPTQAEGIELEMLYTTTCGCCKLYKGYLEGKGFKVKPVLVTDSELARAKSNLNIPASMQSCHTLKAGNYFIEGHMLVEAIEKLLNEKPEVLGIVLPGMPEGSPGMPGNKMQPFVVYYVSGDKIDKFMEI